MQKIITAKYLLNYQDKKKKKQIMFVLRKRIYQLLINHPRQLQNKIVIFFTGEIKNHF